MSDEVRAWAKKVPGLSVAAKAVLNALAGYADADGVAWPKLATLSDITCMSQRHVRRQIAHLKAGDVTGLSIGYVLKAAKEHGDGTRTLTEVDLREISVVAIPANRRARIVGVKSVASQRELQSLLHDSGLPRAAAAKVAAAGWPALAGRDDLTPEIKKLGALVKAATARLSNPKG